ncbi:dienelactone hydrolase family protein [Nocardia sp. NPDC003482]
MPEISYPAPSGSVPGYLAVPDGTGPWPGVVVVHDAFGMTDDIRRITDRFAGAGYLTLTPALFRRGNRIRCVVETMRTLSANQGPAVDDLRAAGTYLADDDRCTGKVGVVGFCMGGGFCLLLAPTGTFDAAAPNYGFLPKDLATLRHSCPMVASYGGKDRGLRGAADRLEAALGEVPHDVEEYPNVGHSFMNDWRAPAPLRVVERVAGLQYSRPEAEDAWRRILAFFGEHLGQGQASR